MKRDRRDWHVTGIDTCMYDTGPTSDGAPVIFVHGGDPRSLSNALDWSTVWRPTELDARLIAYDKPGQGRTYSPDLPELAMSATGLSRHLEGVIERSGAERVVLVGHSRGALPVADVALRLPERVAGLVLVSSNTLAPPSPATPTDFYRKAYADPPAEPTEEYVRREPTMNSRTTDHIDAAFLAGRRDPALLHGWWMDRARRTAIYEQVTQPSLGDLRRTVLKTIDDQGFVMPALQVWGQEDVSAPVELASALYATITTHTRDCWSVVLNRSGHYVYRERAEAFTRLLGTFLEALRHEPAF